MEQIALYNYKERFERRLADLTTAEYIQSENKKMFIDFLTDISATVTDGRTQKYAFLFLTLGKLAEKSFRRMSERDYRILVKKINDLTKETGKDKSKPMSEWYKADMRTALKVFIKWFYGKKYNAKDWEWLKTSLPSHIKKSRVEEGQILNVEEIEKIIAVCDNTRDKALISVTYETTARPSEVLSLKVGSIRFDKQGAVVYIQQSKTKPRPIRIISSATYLRAWINIHPFKDDPEALLWIRYRTTPSGKETIGIPAFNKLLKTLAKKAKIKKRVYPYILRHSRITHLIQEYPDQIVKKISGHSPTSKHFEVYLHITDEDVNRHILEKHGLLKSKEVKRDLEEPIQCWNCKTLNNLESKFCEKCNFSLDFSNMQKTFDEMKKVTPLIEKLLKMQDENVMQRELVERKANKEI